MNTWKYLRDCSLFIFFWLCGNGLTVMILYLTPENNFKIKNYFYIFLLQSMLLLCFLAYDYFRKFPWWQELSHNHAQDLNRDQLTKAKTQEALLVQEHINQLLLLHQEHFKDMMQEAHQQRDFIDSWVHEIKVPLAATKLLMESGEDYLPENTYYKMENELQRIDDYVEQVLYYSRLDAFSKDYLIQETSLKESVQKAIRPFANYFIEKNLHFSLTGDDSLVLTDQKWLIFILTQIISNSIKYTEKDGHIQVAIFVNPQGQGLSVTDDGCGIPIEDQRRIFEKGFTGNNGRDKQQKATGLGLYLSKQLAKKLGHQLYVTSKLNEGTTIEILFPYLTYYNEEKPTRFLQND